MEGGGGGDQFCPDKRVGPEKQIQSGGQWSKKIRMEINRVIAVLKVAKKIFYFPFLGDNGMRGMRRIYSGQY